MKIEVVVGLDMETDIGSWTPFYEGLVHGTPGVLETLAQQEVEATFFFTGHAARGHPEIVRDVAAAGHEIGAHSIYHETVGEELYPLPGLYPLLPEEVPGRLRVATEMVEDVAGEKVVSFRCPRLFGSTTVTNTLEELGYLADASYPMYYFKDRLLPYHPARDDWTQEGDLTLVEIPNFADMSMASSDEFGRDRDQWPLFRSEGAEALLGHIRGFLDFVAQRHDQACLCFYFHPWEFWPMPEGPIHLNEAAVEVDAFIIKNSGDYALQQFGLTLEGLRQMGAEFLTARSLAQRY